MIYFVPKRHKTKINYSIVYLCFASNEAFFIITASCFNQQFYFKKNKVAMQIKSLELYTEPIKAQKDFYAEVLDLPLLDAKDDSFALQIGKSQLRFTESPTKHYYHFAFNIPSFQTQEALEWLKAKKIPILKEGGNEIIDFVNWNAEAVYFFDPAGNIVEFIARKNLAIPSEGPFGVQSILNISEIGMPVANVQETFDFYSEKYGLEKYSGDLNRFCAAGDEHGLIIIVDEAQKKWYPTEIPAKAFPMNLEIG